MGQVEQKSVQENAFRRTLAPGGTGGTETPAAITAAKQTQTQGNASAQTSWSSDTEFIAFTVIGGNAAVFQAELKSGSPGLRFGAGADYRQSEEETSFSSPQLPLRPRVSVKAENDHRTHQRTGAGVWACVWQQSTRKGRATVLPFSARSPRVLRRSGVARVRPLSSPSQMLRSPPLDAPQTNHDDCCYYLGRVARAESPPRPSASGETRRVSEPLSSGTRCLRSSSPAPDQGGVILPCGLSGRRSVYHSREEHERLTAQQAALQCVLIINISLFFAFVEFQLYCCYNTSWCHLSVLKAFVDLYCVFMRVESPAPPP
ncbi:hypothetical protein P4O66_012798 [Electrophorus voltai]|uniref:Uncharacterized protein n=1 Tax=Electrophorus voltai TaxID=2609070 RepID=A0AAD9E3L5_9TELE|nr:hypothetical protein P4O66_012798 [Electrophorus voltai]